jgi:hypothetical protein
MLGEGYRTLDPPSINVVLGYKRNIPNWFKARHKMLKAKRVVNNYNSDGYRIYFRELLVL